MSDVNTGSGAGTFDSPAKPLDYVPTREGSFAPGYDANPFHDSPDTGDFVEKDEFAPLKYAGWEGHEERSDLKAATGVDHDSDDLS